MGQSNPAEPSARVSQEVATIQKHVLIGSLRKEQELVGVEQRPAHGRQALIAHQPNGCRSLDGVRGATKREPKGTLNLTLGLRTDVARKSHLTFECEPVEEQYRVGAFVISVPYDDIVRVEVYAVPEAEMPVDAPAITGFRGRQEPPAT